MPPEASDPCPDWDMHKKLLFRVGSVVELWGGYLVPHGTITEMFEASEFGGGLAIKLDTTDEYISVQHIKKVVFYLP